VTRRSAAGRPGQLGSYRGELGRQLEVRASKLTLVLVILLGLFFVPMALAVLDIGIAHAAIGVVCLILFGVVVWLVRRGHKKSVRRFFEEGLLRNDGQSFAWADLSRVVNKARVRRYGGKQLWRIEIQFRNGESAWLIPSKISNYREAAALVSSLPCEHTEVPA
jgi:hypothetical protein